MRTLSDNVARPVRTAVQGGLGWTVTEFIDAWLYDMGERQYGALVALLTIVISFIQNQLESGLGKAFLRDVPPGEVPVVDDERGAVDWNNVWVVLGIVGIVLIVLLIVGVI